MLNAHETMHDLIHKDFTPFTVSALLADITGVGGEFSPVAISYIQKQFETLVQNINIALLNTLVKEVRHKFIISENPLSELKLNSNPSLEEATNFCSTVHIEMQALQQRKEELTHIMNYLTQAKGYLTSFGNAAEIIFKNITEKEYKIVKEALLSDLDGYKTFLTNAVKELDNIKENVLSPRMNLCMRMESSLRLLEKYRDPTERGFRIQQT